MSTEALGGNAPPAEVKTGEGWQARRQEIFPLPCLPVEVPGPCSRRAKAGVRRARMMTKRANAAVTALNWMAGYIDVKTFEPNAVQHEVLARVEGLVRDQEPTTACLTAEAAWKELLQGRSLYEDGGANANLAAYQEELLSMPSDTSRCPDIKDILPSDVHHYLEAYQEQMLKEQHEIDELEQLNPTLTRSSSTTRSPTTSL